MKWQKLGNIFNPDNNYPWMATHAANPFAEEIKEGIYKIYFTCRDKQNVSHIAYLVIDIKDPFKILDLSDRPILSPGQLGLFDDSGVAMGYLIKINGKRYLYYLGWNLRVTVPWLNTIGLAIEEDEDSGVFIKQSLAPIMDRSNEDPFSISYPGIYKQNGIYKMWYGSNLNWGSSMESMDHVIKTAWSLDGIKWERDNQIAIDLEHPGEYALSKPFIIKQGDKYNMWYSYRGNGNTLTYRIGLATSNNCTDWKRNDHLAGIDVSSKGWDSEMIEYPFVFKYGDNTYMLYNGNGYGRTGFGLAVLRD